MKTENKNAKECKKIAVLTSGGDAPGMNATIRSIVIACIKKKIKIYGINNGYLGLYQNQINLLEFKNLPRVINGGTFLGTARSIPFKENIDIQAKCLQNLQQMNIDKLIIIGGDGSFKGANKLSKLGLKCIAIPATIDNDIHTTEYTIGFSTALNTIVENIEKLRDTAIACRRCMIIEVMGKNKADLALYSGIAAGADLIITHENILDKEIILQKIKKMYDDEKDHIIVVITENIFDVKLLAKEIETYSGFETRSQILGHIQRGGNPTAEDLVLAFRMGNYAIELCEQDIYNCVIGIKNSKLNYINFDKIVQYPYSRNELFNIIKK